LQQAHSQLSPQVHSTPSLQHPQHLHSSPQGQTDFAARVVANTATEISATAAANNDLINFITTPVLDVITWFAMRGLLLRKHASSALKPKRPDSAQNAWWWRLRFQVSQSGITEIYQQKTTHQAASRGQIDKLWLR
jgi:hypothetical protein